MRYSKKRRLYSQNFLRDPELTQKLIRNSSISPNDIVLEIGPGKGMITQYLLNIGCKVIAVEKDERLYRLLQDKFKFEKQLDLYCADYLLFASPDRPYKVFSNIPFSITADIMRKLTQDLNFIEGYLIVQKEAAKKFLGMPYAFKNSMMSVLLKPWFTMEIFWTFKPSDFIPVPSVDIVMIHIKRKKFPDINIPDKRLYRSFITLLFNRERVARKAYGYLLRRFVRFKNNASENEIKYLFTEFENIEKYTAKIDKLRRTRVGKRHLIGH